MEIHCQEKFDEVKKYAESIGDQTFNNCIERLKEWEKDGKHTVHLYNDFAKHSFYFQEFDVNGRCVMNGGVIYHEPGNDHSFSVCIDADEMIKPEWRIHT